MGYVPRRTFKIVFREGHEFDGLEVRMKSVSVGKLLALLPVVDQLDDMLKSSDLEPVESVFRELAALIDWWNVEEEELDLNGVPTGKLVPVTPDYAGLVAQDLRMVNAIMRQWAKHVAGVSAPLDGPSPSGNPSLEASIPMETLSPSLLG